MTIYCDIDSTINNHWVRIQKYSENRGGHYVILPGAFSRKSVMEDEPLPGAYKALRKLYLEDHTIKFLTARSFSDAKSITNDWLEKYDFLELASDVIVVPSPAHKVEILRAALRNGESLVFIDDLTRGHHEPTPSLLFGIIELLLDHSIPHIIFSHTKGGWDSASNKIYKQIEKSEAK